MSKTKNQGLKNLSDNQIRWVYAYHLNEAAERLASVRFYKNNRKHPEYPVNADDKLKQFRSRFVISLLNLIDLAFTDDEKHDLKANNALIKGLIDYRNKRGAHLDLKVEMQEITDPVELVHQMVKEFNAVKACCGNKLPKALSVPKVSFDFDLFRAIHGINNAQLDKICLNKYGKVYKEAFPTLTSDETHAYFDSLAQVEVLKTLNSTKALRDKTISVLIRDGFTDADGLLKRTQATILINIIDDSNVTVRLNDNPVHLCAWNRLHELGILSECNEIQEGMFHVLNKDYLSR